MIVCLYHKSDLDGRCSAAIVSMATGHKSKMIGWTYGDTVPWGDLEPLGWDDRVILVDLTLPPHDMVRLEAQTSLAWIDHHKDAIERLILDHPYMADVPGPRDPRYAACCLAWRYFFRGQKLPVAVDYIGAWDTWEWVDRSDRREIEAFQFGMRAMDTEPDEDVWRDLLKERGTSLVVETVCRDGVAILQYRDCQNERIAKSAFETTLGGHKILSLNAGGGSELFDSVRGQHQGCVATAAFFWAGTAWKVSLRSIGDFDVAALARQFGGNGHPGAAGFTCEELPFRLGQHGQPDLAGLAKYENER